MKMTASLVSCLIGAVSLVAQASLPDIQNGRVDTRAAATIDAALRNTPVSPAPVWLAWREPMIDGIRHPCSTWIDEDLVVRGVRLEPRGTNGADRPRIAETRAAASLEAGTGLVMLLRVVDGRVERLRSIADDCPIDASGTTVVWLNGISAAESLRYLEGIARPAMPGAEARRLASAAAPAIALHRDAGADTVIDRLAREGTDGEREAAWRLLAAYRGRRGYDALTHAIAAEPAPAARQQLVSALRQSSEADAGASLLALARTDPEERVRAEAIAGYAAVMGPGGLAEVLDVAAKDSSEGVQRRAVGAIARLPPATSVPALLSVARTSGRPAMRKEAVAALGRIDDPRALAYLEEVVIGSASK